MVLLVWVKGDSVLFQTGEGGERSGTVVTVVVLFGLSSTGLAGWGGDIRKGGSGGYDGSTDSGYSCDSSDWFQSGYRHDGWARSMNERVSKMIA